MLQRAAVKLMLNAVIETGHPSKAVAALLKAAHVLTSGAPGDFSSDMRELWETALMELPTRDASEE